jgi:hypothetical protein
LALLKKARIVADAGFLICVLKDQRLFFLLCFCLLIFTNSKTVSTKPITKREKTAMAGYRISNVVIVLPHQSA